MLEYLKREIQRGLRVLGPEAGEADNQRQILGWLNDGTITEKEADELEKFNKKQAKALEKIRAKRERRR